MPSFSFADFVDEKENGWTVSKGIPERDVFTRPTTDYNGVGGPYAELGISQSKSFEITAAQYGSFRNCYRDDNVCLLGDVYHRLCFHPLTLELLC